MTIRPWFIRACLTLLLVTGPCAPSHADTRFMPVGPFGGYVSQVVFSKTQRGVLYAAATGGVYVSRDGGLTWALLGDETGFEADGVPPAYAGVQEDTSSRGNVYALRPSGLVHYDAATGKWTSLYRSRSLSSLAVDPSNPKHLFIASRPAVSESWDGGHTFTPIYENGCSSVSLSPANPRLISCRQFPNAIFLSPDGGTTWAQHRSAGKGMAFAGGAPGRVYGFQEGKAGLDGASHTFIARSDDAGATWIRTASVLAPRRFVTTGDYVEPRDIYADPHDPDVAYLVYMGGASFAGYKVLYKTTDGGITWAPTAFKSDANIGGLAVDPFDSNHIVIVYDGGYTIGGFSLASSWNGGDDFIDTETGLSAQFAHGIQVDPVTPGTLYAVTSAGMFRSQDGGARWQHFGPPLVAHTKLALDPHGTGYLYFSEDEVGFAYLYDIGADAWYDFADTGGQTTIKTSETTPGVLYVGICSFGYGTVATSLDYGVTWQPPYTNLCEQPADFASSALTPGKVYQYMDGLIEVSLDDGIDWTRMASATTIGREPFPNTPIAVSRQSDDTLFTAGTEGIATSTDGASRWKRTYACPFSSCGISSIYVDPVDIGKVYAPSDRGVLESDDDGLHWAIAAMPGLEDHMPNLMMHPSWAPDVFAIGTKDAGVFLKTDPTDLQVSMAGTSGLVELGDTFSYTATVSNAGAVDAGYVSLVLDSPSNMTMTLTDAGGGTCTSETVTAGTRLACELPSLTAGGQWAVTVDGRMDFGDQAAITAVANTAQGDTNFRNNSAILETESLEGTDLSVDVKSVSRIVAAGIHGKLFTVTVNNKGADTPVDLKVHYTSLVQGLLASPSRRCTAIDHGFTCHINKLTAGQSATFDFAGSLPAAGYFTIGASVAPIAMRDTRQINDSDSATIIVH